MAFGLSSLTFKYLPQWIQPGDEVANILSKSDDFECLAGMHDSLFL